MEINDKTTDKKCKDHCPNCGTYGMGNEDPELIKWEIQADEPPYYKAECKVCGCKFHEVYDYSHTTFNLGDVDRVKCDYPMSEFYTYMDEIPHGTRVSTPEECEKCEGMVDGEGEPCCEDVRHCLIDESKPDPVNDLLVAAMEIVFDFDNYGEVLQSGKDGEYGPDSSIEKLRKAVDNYRKK